MLSTNVDWDSLISIFKERYQIAKFDGSKKELIIKCPFCQVNDDRKHGKLYISTDDDSLIYNCYLCEKSGLLINLLKDIGLDPKIYIFDYEERIKNIRSYVKKRKKSTTVLKKEIVKYHLENNEVKDKFIEKKNYIKGRMGFAVDLNTIPNMIFSIKDFLSANTINLNSITNEMLEFLEHNFVGFLLNLGTKIVFRNIDSNSSFRYYNMVLQNTDDNVKDFYGFETGFIDENMNNIILCEGIFDLLVSYYSKSVDTVYNKVCYAAAILGKSYYNSVEPVLDYCGLSMANIIVLSDSDVEIKKYGYLYYKNPMVNSLRVLKNKVGKDFGKLPIFPTGNLFVNFLNRKKDSK